MTDQELAALKAEIEADVQAYNSTFVKAVHANDASLMRPWMRLPVLSFARNGDVGVMTAPEDIDARYEAGIRALDGTGYERSVLSNFDITVLNPATALVKCDALRERKDGSVVASFAAAYIWSKGPERWQIAAFVMQRG
jgi:sugar phosphate isomerase/epimerase